MTPGSWVHRLRWPARLRGFLFIAGHQRSYSTLLAHLLGSSPEIAGYREHHLAYRSPSALWTLGRRQAEEFPEKRPAWILDKVLHDSHALPPWMLHATPCRLILLLRRPAPYLASSLNLQRIVHGPEHPIGPADLAKGVEHYRSRLHTLETLARRVRRPKFYLPAEFLLADPLLVLEALGRFLDLHAPLSTDYQCFPQTGRPGQGDPSPRILSGRVLSGPLAHPFEIPEMPDLEEAWRRTDALLRQTCATLPPAG